MYEFNVFIGIFFSFRFNKLYCIMGIWLSVMLESFLYSYLLLF